jgi:hypothetical protein
MVTSVTTERAAVTTHTQPPAKYSKQALIQQAAPHLGHVHSCKDGCCLADAWQPLSQQLRRQVVQVQVDVVLQEAAVATDAV